MSYEIDTTGNMIPTPEAARLEAERERTASGPSDATACSVVAPNLVQAGDLWLMEDEDAYHPDKMEYSLLIQCANADQVRHAMKTGKIEFTVFAHYPQNVHVDTSPPLTPQDDAQR